MIGYTPEWLLRLIADGAFVVAALIPSAIGLAAYAIVVFYAIDALFSAVLGFSRGRVLAGVLAERDVSVGAPAHRVRLYLPIFLEWCLKLWIGLPMVYVVNLMLAGNARTSPELAAMISGFEWELRVLRKLPLPLWPGLDDLYALVAQTVFVALMFAFLFWYWKAGFEIARDARKVGDALLQKLNRAPGSLPTLRQALNALEGLGWPPASVRSAAWFLSMLKLRIQWDNPTYKNFPPSRYALYRVARDIGLASVLFALHPVATGLYVGFKLKAGGKVFSTRRIFRKHFAMLPEDVKKQVASTL